MLYSITITYRPSNEISEDVRKSLQSEHFGRLVALKNNGSLLAAGPHLSTENQDSDEPSVVGSLVVAEFDSLSSAQSWAASDPYAEAGFYSDINIHPFKKILP